MPKPTEQIMAWIATLSPPDELAVRMALSESNPWCHEDKPWQRRIAKLQAELVTSEDDRRRYEERAAKIARDMEGAIRDLKAQATDPAAEPALVST
ncbi:MAG TPA: hypothetical protein VG328_01500 [Stellaceae bacterium]|jgi:hypothetical protein|nr:hypothetical protein [Stellaceae bacterium]